MPFAKSAKATPTYFRARSGALEAMKLELPTKKQFIRAAKYSLMIAVPGLMLAAWLVHKDPVRIEAEDYLYRSLEISEEVGDVNSINMISATYVQSAVEFSGKHRSPYNLYRYNVNGSVKRAVATIRVDEPGTGHEIFSVKIEW